MELPAHPRQPARPNDRDFGGGRKPSCGGAKSITSALRVKEYAAVEAGNGLELPERIEAHFEGGGSRDFLVLTDIRMPELSGMDVLCVLSCARHEAPTILMTAFGDEETRREAYELGAAAVLAKPSDLDELCAVVASAARRVPEPPEPTHSSR